MGSCRKSKKGRLAGRLGGPSNHPGDK